MIIDAHVHVFLSRSQDPERSVDALAPAEREAPVALLEQQMRTAGVDGAVLVPLGPEDTYVAAVVAGARSRYRAIAVATPALTSTGPPGPGADPGRVAARLDHGGFSGLRFFELPGRIDDAPPWLAVLRRLAADGRILWMYPRVEDLPTLHDVARALPDLQIVLNHTGFTQSGIEVDAAGRPHVVSPVPQPHEDQVLALAAFPNVAVKLSGAYGFSAEEYPYPDVAGVTARVADRFGTERLAWASDFPWIVEQPGYRACLELIDHHLPGLSAAERAAILGGNIRRLLTWEATDADRPAP
jgi:L-fuconolactonase